MKITIYTKEGDYYEYENPKEVIVAQEGTLKIESDKDGFYIREQG